MRIASTVTTRDYQRELTYRNYNSMTRYFRMQSRTILLGETGVMFAINKHFLRGILNMNCLYFATFSTHVQLIAVSTNVD